MGVQPDLLQGELLVSQVRTLLVQANPLQLLCYPPVFGPFRLAGSGFDLFDYDSLYWLYIFIDTVKQCCSDFPIPDHESRIPDPTIKKGRKKIN